MSEKKPALWLRIYSFLVYLYIYIPIIILIVFSFIQRHLVRGLTFGAVKG